MNPDWCSTLKLEDDQDLLKPLAEPDIFVHYWRRQRRLTYPAPLVASEPVTLKARVEQDEPVVMAEMKVRDVAIPRTTNVTSCIQKPGVGGTFELKKSMVELLHTIRQFTDLSHEDPQVHIQNFPKLVTPTLQLE
ncbi:hypothetical protein KY285_036104 [Solanum tuberosum]|nr:hypothetical protein KY289_036267 [Solanum tuberosum]KAH0639518.1 hypothetical protein KY285_036104 [Solanum tuberosum]